MDVNPKKWLYNLHKYTSPSPTALKWMVPLLSFPAAYYGHKAATGLGGKAMDAVGFKRGGDELRKSNPLMFATAVTALNTALSQGIYQPDGSGDPEQMKDWKKFFYPEKTASFDPSIIQAAAIQQGWGDDPLMTAKIKRHKWMVPSVNSRALKESIYDTPGFTTGQKTFLRDSVDGAVMSSGSDHISANDLGIGASRAIVNHAGEVPGLFETALKAGTRAAEGAFIGRGLATLLGASPAATQVFQNTGLAAGVLNTSEVMQKIKSYF